MNYLSLCSGIEAATVAWEPLGWKPVGFSEIEKFPSAVLKYHYPDVPNYGDMTNLVEKDWTNEQIDLVCGGSPCQGFSCAGKRGGMDDPRSQLAGVFVELCFRTGARWFLWENVPGCLSSTKGKDFASLLSAWTGRDVEVPSAKWGKGGIVEQADETKFGIAWRVLDAEYCRVDGFERAVPQRRRRVFVVGYLGDWRRPAAVLLNKGSVPGNPPPSREKGKGVARALTSSTGGCSAKEQQHTFIGNGGKPLNPLVVHTTGAGWWKEGCGTLRAREQESHEHLVCMAHGQGGAEINDSLSPSLTCNHEAPIVCRCYENHPQDSRVTDHGDLCPTLTKQTGTGGGNLPLVQQVVSFHGSQDPYASGDVTHPLGTNQGLECCVAFERRFVRTSGGQPTFDLQPCLRAGTNSGDGAPCVATYSYVRRLTPVEASRLMGFPDFYVRIPWRGKPAENCPDGHRYKALGNSWAVNCARWIGRRIEMVENIANN